MMKLNYFNGRGLAETSRLIFAVSGKKYEDFRYPLEIIDWKTYNMVRKEFDEDKASGKLWRSMGKLPFLEVDGQVISQSKSIERYLARRFKLMGDTNEESALIDSYCEYIRDFKTAYQTVRKAENKEEAMEKWFGETLPEKLSSFEKILYENTDFQNTSSQIKSVLEEKRFSVGDKLSLADIVIYSFLVDFFDNKEGVNKSFEQCKTLRNIVNTVSNNPNIKNWVENRAETAF
jgi:prostaglandin-H2 D-isomerase / glutathione transferase